MAFCAGFNPTIKCLTQIYNNYEHTRKKDLVSFALEKAHSIDCPILTGCTINSVPMEELTKMTKWFSFISKDMAKEVNETARKLNNIQLGLYFQYCIDKAVEITYLAIQDTSHYSSLKCPENVDIYPEKVDTQLSQLSQESHAKNHLALTPQDDF